MSDKHLNLFYSYNRDNELIENNLTRAFIVSLRILSGKTRDCLLKIVFEGKDIGERSIDFANAEFFLQGYMPKEKARASRCSYVVAIASDIYEPNETEIEVYGDSIPDAWIFNETSGYCFLIEAKVGQYPLDDIQLHSHAKDWLGLSTKEEITKHIVSITWLDILRAIDQVRLYAETAELSLSNQERIILENLEEYLGFFDYKLFHGFEFKQLQGPPELRFVEMEINQDQINLPEFSILNAPPQFQFNIG